MAPPIAATGQVASQDEMRLSFKLGGVVRRIAVKEGDEVKQGQRLAEIELAEVGAQVEQARQLAAKAQRDLERGERLHADQVISLEQLQDLRTQASVAGAGLKSAQFNLGFSTIVAPRDGVVLRKLVEEREQVAPGAPVLELGSRDGGYVVKLALADREVVQLKLGDPAALRRIVERSPSHDQADGDGLRRRPLLDDEADAVLERERWGGRVGEGELEGRDAHEEYGGNAKARARSSA